MCCIVFIRYLCQGRCSCMCVFFNPHPPFSSYLPPCFIFLKFVWLVIINLAEINLAFSNFLLSWLHFLSGWVALPMNICLNFAKVKVMVNNSFSDIGINVWTCDNKSIYCLFLFVFHCRFICFWYNISSRISRNLFIYFVFVWPFLNVQWNRTLD